MLFHKAVNEFGRRNVNESMGLELLGTMKRRGGYFEKNAD